jgi:asparagine synthase (glutamine-hydrolysing)
MMFLSEDERLRLFSAGALETVAKTDPADFILKYAGEAGDVDDVTRTGYIDVKTYLVDDILVKVDRMSMANSLEVRCPLLDHELAGMAARIPLSWNMAGGRGKQVLLRALGERLPAPLLLKRKTGFSVPLASWFRGPLKDMLRDHLFAPSFLQQGIVAPRFVHYLVDEHLRSARDNYYWLWRLLVLELWLRENGTF